MRAKRASYNAISGLFYEAVAIVAGFILPRLILTRFGSDYNGAIASVTQFIGYIAVFTAGVSAVTQAALYKPLADGDVLKISGITRATEIFMRKTALIFAICLLGFAVLYPFLVAYEFEWYFTFSLVLILGFGTFFQNFFGSTSHMLISANQREYVTLIARASTTILSTTAAIALIFAGSDIRIALLAGALITSANPLFLYFHAHRRYKLIRPIAPDTSAIKQRFNAFAQETAGFICNYSAVIIITIFAGVTEVSVFVVYYMVIRTVGAIVSNLTTRNLAALLGNMLAKTQHDEVRSTIRLYEFLTSATAAIFCACTALLIVPFVSVYTNGVYDANYLRPIFAYVACGALFFYLLRLPYQELVQAAGHFKQTRNGAIAESCVYVISSTALVSWLGIVGVELCKLCTTLMRSVELAVYCSRHIIKRSVWTAARNLLLSLLNVLAIIAVAQLLPIWFGFDGAGIFGGTTSSTRELYSVWGFYSAWDSYATWILRALLVFGTATCVTVIFAGLFYRDEARMLISKLRSVLKRGR